MIAFLESDSYEDAVRNGVSLGGDSDTIACICGGIAQAFYGGVHAHITQAVRRRLPESLLAVRLTGLKRFDQALAANRGLKAR